MTTQATQPDNAWQRLLAQREASAEARGEARGLRAAVAHLCAALGIPLDDDRRARLDALGPDELEARCAKLERDRAWTE